MNKIFRNQFPTPTLAEVNQTRDINRLAMAIEKIEIVLDRVIAGGNHDAILTWARIMAKAKMDWTDAMIEVETNGRYQFE